MDMMDIEDYSKIAPQYFEDDAPPLIVEILNNNDFKRILDCGCGDGSLLYYIKKHRLEKKAEVTGVDLSKERVKIAKKISKKFHVHVDSAETIKTVRTNTVDFFITEQVIEHVDDKKMAEAINRVTKPGGIVYLSTVYKKTPSWYFYKNKIGWVLDPTHLREYTADDQLLKLFKKDFYLILNKKRLQWFPLIDFFIKRLGVVIRNRDNRIWTVIRSVRVPVLQYYLWELVFVKK